MERVKKLLKTSTLRQSSITFTASMINGVLGALFYIVIARTLGPAQFGIFSVAVAASTLLADVSDLGTDTGLVRFVGRYIKKDKQKAYRFLKLTLKIKVVTSLIVISIGLILAPFLADTVFAKPNLAVPLRIAFLGIGSAQLFAFVTHEFQSFQKFLHWGAIFVSTNLLRLILIFFVMSSGVLTSENSLLIYISIPFLGFLIGSFFVPTSAFLKVDNEWQVASEMFHFNKWVTAFTIVAATSSRFDTFISARLLSQAQVGIYSASNQLVQIVPQLIVALGTVFAPKMSEMGALTDLKKYLVKSQIMVTIIAVLGLVAIPIAAVLIPIFYGVAFQGSVPVFVVLFVAMLVFLISVPIHNAIIYYYSYPKLFFLTSLGHLAIIGFVGWQMIGTYGVMGAALTVLLGTIYNFLVPAAWLGIKLKSNAEK